MDPPAQPSLQNSRRKTCLKWVNVCVLVLKLANAGSQKTRESLCVKTKVGLKQKRSTTMDSSDSPEPAWSDSPLRSCRLRRRSPRHRNAWGGWSTQLEYCSRILEEMLSKKHASCARPFYNLMNDEALQLRNHHNVIRNAMDLSTIKVDAAP